jgi:Stage II sporulation protein E (SpoIIE)
MREDVGSWEGTCGFAPASRSWSRPAQSPWPSAGDTVVVYTDGVTDQGAGSTLSSPGEMLRGRAPDSSAEQLASLLERNARQLTGRQCDDIAILALRFDGAGGPATPSPPETPAEEAAVQGA